MECHFSGHLNTLICIKCSALFLFCFIPWFVISFVHKLNEIYVICFAFSSSNLLNYGYAYVIGSLTRYIVCHGMFDLWNHLKWFRLSIYSIIIANIYQLNMARNVFRDYWNASRNACKRVTYDLQFIAFLTMATSTNLYTQSMYTCATGQSIRLRAKWWKKKCIGCDAFILHNAM